MTELLKTFGCGLIMFLTIISTQAQTEGFQRGILISKGDSLPYRIQPPLNLEVGTKYPIILYLHGSGSIGRDNESSLKYIPKIFTDTISRRSFPAYIIVPQCRPGDSWTNFPNYPKNLTHHPEMTRSLSMVFELLDSITGKLNIDKKRIFVTGISLGAEGTYEMIQRRPTYFAAAIPICGLTDTAKTSCMTATPLWIGHGEDDKVISVTYSRMIVKALELNGIKPKYSEYPGMGHRCWDLAYLEFGMMEWLFSQRNSGSVRGCR